MSVDALEVYEKFHRSKQRIDAKDLSHVTLALDLFTQLRHDVVAQFATYDSRPLKSYEQSRLSDLRETLRQIDEGFHPDEGADPRLYELVSRPEITRLRLARPGIASLKRLQARLVREQRAYLTSPGVPGASERS